MKSFTIENETNNITSRAAKQDAELVEGTECFASEAGLASLAAAWPTARLIEIWNSLPGVIAVTKFKDRKTAVARIWKAIQSLDNAPAAAPKAATKATPTRAGSKTSRVIEMLKREGGATLQEIMTGMGWQSHTTRALMSAGGSLTKKHGLTVVSTKNENGERAYSIKA